jgi:hypothetical protein
LVVHVDGIYQLPGINFTANADYVTFVGAPAANAEIIIQNTTPVIDLESRWYWPFSQNITADGTNVNYVLSGNIAGQNSLLIHIDGIYQIPGVNFSANSTYISFYNPPVANSEITVQHSGTLIAASGGNATGGAQVAVSATAPLNPQEGDLWLDSDNGKLAVYLANGWIEVGGSSTLFTANDFIVAGGIDTEGNIRANNFLANVAVYASQYFYSNGTPFIGGAGLNGATGATGPAGNPGNPGSAGTAGATGATGPVGASGAAGTPGTPGTAGGPGATGATGVTGSPGSPGSPGTVGSTGATGSVGTPGVAGATGSTGPIGPPGTPGVNNASPVESFTRTFVGTGAEVAFDLAANVANTNQLIAFVDGIYQIPGTNFTSNSSWIIFTSAPVTNSEIIVQSSTNTYGATGPQGATGAPGTPGGATGIAGPQGSTGATGPVGATGSSGSAGTPGTPGTEGATGATGIGSTGATGAPGPAGTSANITVYDEGTLVAGSISSLNFVGSAVEATTSGSNVTITVTATAGNIGNVILTTGFVDRFTGNGVASNYSLSTSLVSSRSVVVFVDSVYQIPDIDFTIADNLLSFAGVPDANADIVVQGFSNQLGTDPITADPTGIQVNTSAIALDQFGTTNIRTAKYVISISNSTEYQATEAMIVHNGTTAQLVTYATVYTGAAALMTFSTDISSGQVRLLGTGAGSGNVVKLQKTYVKV